jgi:hypothetical protein
MIYRFGVIWKHIRESYIRSPIEFLDAIREAYSSQKNIIIEPVFAIIDFKQFYDQFIDSSLKQKYVYENETQHVFKFDTCIPGIHDEDKNKYNLFVRTNCRKYAQEVTICLRESGEEDVINTLTPIIYKSNWIPENAVSDQERAAGFRFLREIPPKNAKAFLKPKEFIAGWILLSFMKYRIGLKHGGNRKTNCFAKQLLYFMGEYSLNDALKGFINNSKLRNGIRALQIEEVWEKIMGKTIARYTDHIQIINQTLFISSSVAQLKNELLYQKDKIIERVNEALGDKVINDVVIK